jgi:hypothetical protein
MALAADLERVAGLAGGHAAVGETISGVLAAEPSPGRRFYLCAFEDPGANRTWLVLDGDGNPVVDRARVRDAVSITALCEVAVEAAGGGDLEELRAQLVALRLRENPPGIDEAEEAALALERALGVAPRLASPAFLDEIGAATLRLEQALGTDGPSPFAEAMKLAVGSVEALTEEVERGYKVTLS